MNAMDIHDYAVALARNRGLAEAARDDPERRRLSAEIDKHREALSECLAQPVQPAFPKFEIKHRFCGDEYVSLNDVRSAWPQPVQPEPESKT